LRPSSPHIIPIPSPPKYIFVRVMSIVLKPQIICLRFPPPSGPATKCAINLIGVVPPSAEAVRKGEENFSSANCWAVVGVIFYMFQRLRARVTAKAPNGWKSPCGRPFYKILNPCRVPPNTFCSCDVKSVEAPNYLSTVPPKWPCHEVGKSI